MKEIVINSDDEIKALEKYFSNNPNEYEKFNTWKDANLKNELSKAASNYCSNHMVCDGERVSTIEGFKAGALWVKNKFNSLRSEIIVKDDIKSDRDLSVVRDELFNYWINTECK